MLKLRRSLMLEKELKSAEMILAHVEVVRNIRTAAEEINKELFVND